MNNFCFWLPGIQPLFWLLFSIWVFKSGIMKSLRFYSTCKVSYISYASIKPLGLERQRQFSINKKKQQSECHVNAGELSPISPTAPWLEPGFGCTMGLYYKRNPKIRKSLVFCMGWWTSSSPKRGIIFITLKCKQIFKDGSETSLSLLKYK